MEKYDSHVIEEIGIHNGYQYVIAFVNGGWRTAYINVTGTRLENTSENYYDYDVPVHWGLTWSSFRLPWEEECDFKKWWVGWDYTHWKDAYDISSQIKYFGSADDYCLRRTEGHIWTTEEVREEVKEACKFLAKYYPKTRRV